MYNFLTNCRRLLMPLTLILAPLCASAWQVGDLGEFRFERVNEGVWVMHGPLGDPSVANRGFMNNPAIVLTPGGAVLVDPGSSTPVGRQVLREVKRVTDRPVIAVFDTHVHGDHWLGNEAVREAFPEARIYGHPEMIAQAGGGEGQRWTEVMARLTEGASAPTRPVPPDQGVGEGTVLEIGGHHFRIHSRVPAHTDTDIMIEHVESRTLFLGDNGFVDRLGRFDGSASMHGNIEVLRYARGLGMEVYVPGHGRSGDAEAVIDPFLSYLEKLRGIVKEGYDEGLADYEIKQKALPRLVRYHSWVGFEENFGRHVNKMYLEVEERDM